MAQTDLPPARLFTWEEIKPCSGRSPQRWLVVHRKVYDISQFHKRHPGGSRVISHYAGQDATVRGGEGTAGVRRGGEVACCTARLGVPFCRGFVGMAADGVMGMRGAAREVK